MVTIYSNGATEEVTGSIPLIALAPAKYMIDCGIFQGNDAYKKNKEKELDINVNGVILTHVHADHSCLIPKLIKNGYRGKRN